MIPFKVDEIEFSLPDTALLSEFLLVSLSNRLNYLSKSAIGPWPFVGLIHSCICKDE